MIVLTYHQSSCDGSVYIPTEFLHASEFSVSEEFGTSPAKIVVVGGGLTAGTLAKSLSEEGHDVTLMGSETVENRAIRFSAGVVGAQGTHRICKRGEFSATLRDNPAK